MKRIHTRSEACSLNDIDFEWKIVARRPFVGQWRYAIPSNELSMFRELAIREKPGDQPGISICSGRDDDETVLYARIFPPRFRRDD